MRLVVHELAKTFPGGYAYLVARTRFFDSVALSHMQKHKNGQIVLLGAGFDTRAYRLDPNRTSNTEFFELDRPAPQRLKRERLAQAGVDTSHVVFIECDFNNQTQGDAKNSAVARALRQTAGFDPQKPTLFIWEGVSYYLQAQGVESILEFVAHGDGAETHQWELTFDFMSREAVESPHSFPGCSEVMASVNATSEPLIFGIPTSITHPVPLNERKAASQVVTAATEQFVSRFGLTVVRHSGIGFEELVKRTDGVSVTGTCYENFHLAVVALQSKASN